MLPLYKEATKSPRLRRQGHAGLWFDKFCDRWSASWSMSSSDGNSNPKLKWIGTVIGSVGDEREVKDAASRLISLVDARNGIWAAFAADSRFVTGLGRSHPVENGFAWHHTLGTPFLPGSSVKGMVRAWAKAKGEEDKVNRLLGKQDDPGSIAFLDAIPTGSVQLEADVMTPHYGGWNPDNPPGDWNDPTPIPFLTVAKGASFLFGIVPCSDDVCDDELNRVWEWLKDALDWTGAGAKTAVGYGRFAHDKAKTEELKNDMARVEREREERRRQEEEARAREARFASLTPPQRQLQEIADNRTDKGMPETTAMLNAIRDGDWSGDEKIEAALYLKGKMRETGGWKEETRQRRPERDRAYQRTLRVMRWIAGE